MPLKKLSLFPRYFLFFPLCASLCSLGLIKKVGEWVLFFLNDIVLFRFVV
jgi:hypothetical protein